MDYEPGADITMTPPLLIVPGYRGSGPGHWQTWLQTQAVCSVRVSGIDWDAPILAHWAERVRAALAQATEPQWVIAHSFGCLAAVVAAADRPEQVAQLILVAPADPDRFDFTGLKPETASNNAFSLSAALPRRSLQVPGCVIGSRNDPWLDFAKATTFAQAWQLEIIDAGSAGHINPDAGYGPWPFLLELLEQRCQQPRCIPTAPSAAQRRGRGSTLAAVRQFTRTQLDKPRLGRSRGE